MNLIRISTTEPPSTLLNKASIHFIIGLMIEHGIHLEELSEVSLQ